MVADIVGRRGSAAPGHMPGARFVTAQTAWTTGILLAICSGLVGTIALEISDELPLVPDVTAASRPAPEIAVPDPITYAPPQPEQFTIISRRPLFSASRRPYVPPKEDPAAEAAPEPVAPRTSVKLVGVLLSDKGRAALLRTEGASAVWRHEGQTFDGWTVEAVTADEATLRRADEMMTVQLPSH